MVFCYRNRKATRTGPAATCALTQSWGATCHTQGNLFSFSLLPYVTVKSSGLLPCPLQKKALLSPNLLKMKCTMTDVDVVPPKLISLLVAMGITWSTRHISFQSSEFSNSVGLDYSSLRPCLCQYVLFLLYFSILHPRLHPRTCSCPQCLLWNLTLRPHC